MANIHNEMLAHAYDGDDDIHHMEEVYVVHDAHSMGVDQDTWSKVYIPTAHSEEGVVDNMVLAMEVVEMA